MAAKKMSGTTKRGPQNPMVVNKALPTPAAGTKVTTGVEPGGFPVKGGKGPKRKPGT
jgi:hypothetical protein